MSFEIATLHLHISSNIHKHTNRDPANVWNCFQKLEAVRLSNCHLTRTHGKHVLFIVKVIRVFKQIRQVQKQAQQCNEIAFCSAKKCKDNLANDYSDRAQNDCSATVKRLNPYYYMQCANSRIDEWTLKVKAFVQCCWCWLLHYLLLLFSFLLKLHWSNLLCLYVVLFYTRNPKTN